MTSSHPISADGLSRLNRGEIRAVGEIKAVLYRARDLGIWLTSGMDLSVRPRRAKITDVDDQGLTLRGENLVVGSSQLRLNLEMGGARYFFASTTEGLTEGARSFRLTLPKVLYRAERRDVPRFPGRNELVELLLEDGVRAEGAVLDRSYEGLAVRVQDSLALRVGTGLRVRTSDSTADPAYAQVRYFAEKKGWRQLGLSVSQVAPQPLVRVEKRDDILARTPAQRRWASLTLAAKAAVSAPKILVTRTRVLATERSALEPITYENERGEHIRGLVTRVGDSASAPLILIPPAWGRTKETLLPLADTIAASFRAAGEPVTILRYDERNRRGESYIDPESKALGEDGLNYTFSGAVEDIHTSLRFLRDCPDLNPSQVVLVTVSLASIQGRRAVATDPTGLLSGWISLVGMPDLQSSMRAVTGGIDWIYGLTQGVRFGRQELVGVLVDMDNAGPDTLKHGLGYFEDAKRDMAAVRVPVVWIHGRHDGWMSLDRVQELMSCGDVGRRRLLEVPTGHQLRTSGEALDAFQLVAQEASEVILGRRIPGALPDLVLMDRTRAAERARRPRSDVNLRKFWHDYLLGRDEVVGMELMGATSLYRDFLDAQISQLQLRAHSRILDLGAGTGELVVRLAETGISGCHVTALDFVHPALNRARSRFAAAGGHNDLHCVVADLGSREGSVPLVSGGFDAILASLLVSYLDDPDALLQEARRLLRRGGRIVISAPRRDADISKLFTDTVSERFWGHLGQRFDEGVIQNIEQYQAEFLNNAAKVLELEDDGSFRFYDSDELERMLRDAGFGAVQSTLSFGSPGQFVVASAER